MDRAHMYIFDTILLPSASRIGTYMNKPLKRGRVGRGSTFSHERDTKGVFMLHPLLSYGLFMGGVTSS